MKTIAARIIALSTIAAALLTSPASSNAADREASHATASVATLPAALQAAGVGEAAILDDEQAEQVRGEWVLNLRLGLGHLYFQGAGRTNVEVHTISTGAWYGKPTRVQLRIGR